MMGLRGLTLAAPAARQGCRGSIVLHACPTAAATAPFSARPFLSNSKTLGPVGTGAQRVMLVARVKTPGKSPEGKPEGEGGAPKRDPQEGQGGDPRFNLTAEDGEIKLAGDLFKKYVVEGAKSVEDVRAWLGKKGIVAYGPYSATGAGGRKHPYFRYVTPGHKGKANSSKEVARRLELRPKNAPAAAEAGPGTDAGRPWLADVLMRDYVCPVKDVRAMVALLESKHVDCVTAYYKYPERRAGAAFEFRMPDQNDVAKSAKDVAGWLGLRPKPVDKPDPAVGLPYLAAKLAEEYVWPGPGRKADWEGWLERKGVQCVSSSWNGTTPRYVFSVPEHKATFRSVAPLATALGLQAKRA